MPIAARVQVLSLIHIFDNQPEFFMTIEEAARYVSEIVRKRVPSKMRAIHNACLLYTSQMLNNRKEMLRKQQYPLLDSLFVSGLLRRC